jgi:hypothetical protein
VVNSDEERSPVVARTVGHRRWRSGRRVTVEPCAAHGLVGLAGDGQRAVVDSEPMWRKKRRGNGALTGDVSVSLGSSPTITVEDVEAQLSTGLDSNGRE